MVKYILLCVYVKVKWMQSANKQAVKSKKVEAEGKLSATHNCYMHKINYW